MIKKVSTIISLAICFVCWATLPIWAAAITLDILDPQIMPGESFEVAVYAQEDASYGDLISFGFEVDAASALSLVSYTGVDFTNPDYDDWFSDGKSVYGAYNDVGNVGHNVLLANLLFTAGSLPGTETLLIEGVADGFYGLYYEFDPAPQGMDMSGTASIEVAEVAQLVPLPGAFLFMGAGLLGFAGFNQRKKSI